MIMFAKYRKEKLKGELSGENALELTQLFAGLVVSTISVYKQSRQITDYIREQQK